MKKNKVKPHFASWKPGGSWLWTVNMTDNDDTTIFQRGNCVKTLRFKQDIMDQWNLVNLEDV